MTLSECEECWWWPGVSQCQGRVNVGVGTLLPNCPTHHTRPLSVSSEAGGPGTVQVDILVDQISQSSEHLVNFKKRTLVKFQDVPPQN